MDSIYHSKTTGVASVSTCTDNNNLSVGNTDYSNCQSCLFCATARGGGTSSSSSTSTTINSSIAHSTSDTNSGRLGFSKSNTNIGNSCITAGSYNSGAASRGSGAINVTQSLSSSRSFTCCCCVLPLLSLSLRGVPTDPQAMPIICPAIFPAKEMLS